MPLMRLAAFALSLLAFLGWSVTPAAAQSILRDAETEALLHDMAAPLIEAAGLKPANVDVVLVNDNDVNAFVAGGQAVYINAGLINEADTAAQVQGVIAHELGHVVGGHAVLRPGDKIASNISILSLLLGAAAAVAGSPEAGMGVMMAGQQTALGKYLAYTRAQEASADAAGATFLSKAGISGRGSVEFFQKLQNLEFRHGYSPQDANEFYSTHPLTGECIQTLQDTYEKDPAWTKPDDPVLQKRFVRMKAKLFGYLADPQLVLRKYPPSDTSVPARYARAYAYNRESEFDKARAEVLALVTQDPDDPYFLEMQGQILLESGHPAEALAPLRKATQETGNQPLIATLFGHALIATDDPVHHDEARDVLKAAVARDRDNPFAWYQLGVIYAQEGDMPRAYLASAEQQSLSGNMGEALRSAQAAEAGLPQYSADWLRAQDIELEARADLERNPKHR